MARKTFISYKYSEAQELRDTIIKSLGKDALFYKGETSETPNKTDTTTANIKEHLKKMIHDTSVLIVIISPNMIESNWIDWEISYALKEITRDDKTSRINGIIGVIQKDYKGYEWLITKGAKGDGTKYISHKGEKLYEIIKKNRHNSTPPKYAYESHKIWCSEEGSYISLVKEEIFLKDPKKHIEQAYNKIKDVNKNYNITKTLEEK